MANSAHEKIKVHTLQPIPMFIHAMWGPADVHELAPQMEDDEGCAVAGGEGRDLLQDTALHVGVFLRISKTNDGLGCSRRVSGEKVVTSLLRCKLANGGQHAECIACQYDIAGLAVNNTQDAHIGDEFDWVYTLCVLSDAHIIIVRCVVCGVVDDVLKD
jgi:hypothetical protein